MIDRVVLITGAARGLGRAISDLFFSEGWRVIAADIDEQAMQDLHVNREIMTLLMDVRSDESVSAAFKKVDAEGITIDLIINNAGIDRYFPLSEAPVDMFKEVFEINFFGGYRVNQTFLPILKKPGGRIIHISSESLNLSVPFMPYPVSKKAVEGYAKTIRQELKFRGIDVVLVRPGAIRTELLENVMLLKSRIRSMKSEVRGNVNTENKTNQEWILKDQLEKFAENAPKNIGKVLQPEEVAAFIHKISRKSSTRAVYKINNSLQLKIAARLPFSLVERLVNKLLKG
jgi:NAD(P)-dependent dehydrogenase (short-subunit alcohol dehydrogenase family)